MPCIKVIGKIIFNAIQFDGTEESAKEIYEFLSAPLNLPYSFEEFYNPHTCTLDRFVLKDDWVLLSDDGRFKCCEAEYFNKAYKKVGE